MKNKEEVMREYFAIMNDTGFSDDVKSRKVKAVFLEVLLDIRDESGDSKSKKK